MDLGQAVIPVFSNCGKYSDTEKGKSINGEMGDTAALALHLLPGLEEKPSELLSKLVLIKTS